MFDDESGAALVSAEGLPSRPHINWFGFVRQTLLFPYLAFCRYRPERRDSFPRKYSLA